MIISNNYVLYKIGSKSIKSERKPLSTLAIKAMKPGSKDLSDTGENTGLRVSCGTTGTKAFYYRYRNPFDKAKTVSLTFGHFPIMALADARIEFQKLKAIRKAKRCPKTERDALKKFEEDVSIQQEQLDEQESFTIVKMIDLYLSNYIEDRVINGKKISGARKLKGQRETRRTLYADVVKVFGDLPATSITRKDIVELINSIIARGAKVQAGNVLRELIAAYEYSFGSEKFNDDFANPALQAKESLKRTKVKLSSKPGTRFLTDKELVIFLNWLPSCGFSTTQKNILRLALWTGMRSGVVCLAEWDEINFIEGTWFVPVLKSKTGTDQYVQLPKQALAFLKHLKLTTGQYVFPSSRTGEPLQQKGLSETAWQLKNPDKIKNGRRYKMNQGWLESIPDWTPHDLRRTVRTGLSRIGCPREIAEAVIGHSKKGIEGTYNLHSYENECRIWLQKWADHLENLTKNN
ncbi:MAG: integrase [Oleiphilaceae bacterium]|jgi:integrase